MKTYPGTGVRLLPANFPGPREYASKWANSSGLEYTNVANGLKPSRSTSRNARGSFGEALQKAGIREERDALRVRLAKTARDDSHRLPPHKFKQKNGAPEVFILRDKLNERLQRDQ